MSPTAILLQAYYETLHGLLVENSGRIETVLNKALAEGFADLEPSGFDAEKFDAYRDAALAFLAERIEMYNLSAAEGGRFAQIAREMTDRIRNLGPSPIRTKGGRELREEAEEVEEEQVSSKK